MKALVAAVLLLAAQLPRAQPVWQPSAGHTQMPLWPGAIPDARPPGGPETMGTTDRRDFVAGRPWTYVDAVSRPTLTVYSPAGKNTGTAAIAFPGGGYQILAIDLEGTEVCDWLNSRGITCVLVKYRVPGEGKLPKSGAYPASPEALQDAERAIVLTRFHAAAWHIDRHKIGVLGFSAGGHLVAATSVHFEKRLYARVDRADDESSRPDFAVALYPGHLSMREGTLALRPDIATRITSRTPPTFLLQNEDDDVDSIWDALSYEAALIKAHVPVEFHSYAQGGHAFGLRKTGHPATDWPALVGRWLVTIGMLPK